MVLIMLAFSFFLSYTFRYFKFELFIFKRDFIWNQYSVMRFQSSRGFPCVESRDKHKMTSRSQDGSLYCCTAIPREDTNLQIFQLTLRFQSTTTGRYPVDLFF